MAQAQSDQLSLKLLDQFSYLPERFIVHRGVAEICESFKTQLQRDTYHINYIVGAKRIGKTHLSIFLAKKGREISNVQLSTGHELSALLCDVNAKQASVPEVLIVDDADLYFQAIQPEMSGAFVAFVELCRRANAKLFFIAGSNIDELPCDDHIKSRLRSGSGTIIQNPEPEEVSQLIDCMAKQRGIALTPSKLGFLTKRVGRSVKAIEECLDRLTMMGRMSEKIAAFEVLNVVV